MKKLAFLLLGLLLVLVLVVGIFASMAPPPAPAPAEPVAREEPVPEAEVATEAVSPSSAYSRTLRGVFIKSITCTPARLQIGDSIDVQIKEAWLEKLWEPKFGGLFGEDDYSRGFATDSALEYPRTQLVLAFTPTSRLGHFQQYSWQLVRADDGIKRHGFSRSSGNQLVMYFLRSNAVFPITFNLVTCPKPGEDCQEQIVGTLTLTD
jgi:hypothetical protein